MATPRDERPARPWTLTADDVMGRLSSLRTGLTPEAVRMARHRWGENRLQERRSRSVWSLLLAQFQSLIVALLAAAALLSWAFGDAVDALAIAGVLLINAGLGFFAELRAVRSMESLRQLGTVSTRVRRGGEEREIPAIELVPGDIVLVEGGDRLTADLRLIGASKLEADESALTGESLPVGKNCDIVPGDPPLAERHNLLFKGTVITRGAGEGVVVATGMDTELGRIARLVEEASDEATPLEERLDALGRRLALVALGVAALTTVGGILAGKPWLLMVETGVALAVAAIPEGLPIVATIALARGMWRMARRDALINRLSAVETLGATSLIFTDKTGTLTENRMTVRRLVLADGEVTIGGGGDDLEGPFERRPETEMEYETEADSATPNLRSAPAGSSQGEPFDPRQTPLVLAALEAGALCNNAGLTPRHTETPSAIGEGEVGAGDPLEIALLVAAAKAGINRRPLIAGLPEVREEAFDAVSRRMATFHRSGDGGLRLAVKGASESILPACTHLRTTAGEVPLDEAGRVRWLERDHRLASEGLRILALAEKLVPSPSPGRGEVDPAVVAPYDDLTLLGLVALLDPPRADVPVALEACRRAGVRVVMVTGDQSETALAIGRAVGLGTADEPLRVVHGSELGPFETLSEARRHELLAASIFARVDPEQKLDLIALHQANGAVVAMTGDGVNDAPALEKADIGVAMGRRGTQVAREAADMVLKDDAFASIIAAIHQGRVIFANIRKFVLYLLSCNVSEVLLVTSASLVAAPLPILPLQILFLNLVTDVFPALALALGEGDPTVLDRPPRPADEPILDRRGWRWIAGFSSLITLSVLTVFAIALLGLGFDQRRAVSVSFLTLALAQLFHVFNLRDRGSHPLANDIVRNPWVWGAIVLCLTLLAAAVWLPPLAGVLEVVDPGPTGWWLVVLGSMAPWALGQVWLELSGPKSRSRTPSAK